MTGRSERETSMGASLVVSRLRAIADLSEKGVAFMSDTDLAEETMEEVALLREAANALTHLGLAAETVVLAWHLAAHYNIPPELHAALSDFAGVALPRTDASSEGGAFEGLTRETLEGLYMGALETIAELETRLPVTEVTNEPGTSWDIAEGVLRIRTAPREKRLQHNPEPMRVLNVPLCVSCRHAAPGCTCGAMDYRWADGSKA